MTTGSTVQVTTSQRPPATAGLTTDHRLSLCVVIATGCVLLLLNVLMLSCVYCRKANRLEGHGKATKAVHGDSATTRQTGFNRITNSSGDRFKPVPYRTPLLPTISSSPPPPPPPPILPLTSSPSAVGTLPRVAAAVGVMAPISTNHLRPLSASKTKSLTVPSPTRMSNNHSHAEMTQDLD